MKAKRASIANQQKGWKWKAKWSNTPMVTPTIHITPFPNSETTRPSDPAWLTTTVKSVVQSDIHSLLTSPTMIPSWNNKKYDKTEVLTNVKKAPTWKNHDETTIQTTTWKSPKTTTSWGSTSQSLKLNHAPKTNWNTKSPMKNWSESWRKNIVTSDNKSSWKGSWKNGKWDSTSTSTIATKKWTSIWKLGVKKEQKSWWKRKHSYPAPSPTSLYENLNKYSNENLLDPEADSIGLRKVLRTLKKSQGKYSSG